MFSKLILGLTAFMSIQSVYAADVTWKIVTPRKMSSPKSSIYDDGITKETSIDFSGPELKGFAMSLPHIVDSDGTVDHVYRTIEISQRDAHGNGKSIYIDCADSTTVPKCTLSITEGDLPD